MKVKCEECGDIKEYPQIKIGTIKITVGDRFVYIDQETELRRDLILFEKDEIKTLVKFLENKVVK